MADTKGEGKKSRISSKNWKTNVAGGILWGMGWLEEDQGFCWAWSSKALWFWQAILILRAIESLRSMGQSNEGMVRGGEDGQGWPESIQQDVERRFGGEKRMMMENRTFYQEKELGEEKQGPNYSCQNFLFKCHVSESLPNVPHSTHIFFPAVTNSL